MLRKPSHILIAVAVAVLAGCGGDETASNSRSVSRVRQGQQASLTAKDYYDVVQKIYLSYFGRPADAGGLIFYSNQLLANNAPTDVVGLSNAYFTNPAVKAIIDSFSNSKESADLYPGTSSEFLDAVYKYLFNRGADPSGKSFWLSGIESGRLTRASAAMYILAGAQGRDLDIIAAKVQVSGMFTDSMNTVQKEKGYAGMDSILKVRSMLGKISDTTDPTTYQGTISNTLTDLVTTLAGSSSNKVEVILAARCAACHAAPPALPGLPSVTTISPNLNSYPDALSNATAIYKSVAVNKTMPPADAPQMSDDERALIAQWYNAGPK